MSARKLKSVVVSKQANLIISVKESRPLGVTRSTVEVARGVGTVDVDSIMCTSLSLIGFGAERVGARTPSLSLLVE